MTWSVNKEIRSRRESLGLSQDEVAERLGVTKSLVSHLEAGKRSLTVEQVKELAALLGLPEEILRPGLGRLPDDIQDFFRAEPAKAVAALRQKTEARPVEQNSTPTIVPMAREPNPPEYREPIPERIEVRRTTSAARTHSYHTKVPPEAIRPFIRAFTRPGETVLDPFCGSGMTGIAALEEGRNALLSDLSPAAIHISKNYTTPCDPQDVEAALEEVWKIVRPTIDWLYRPIQGEGEIVEYTTWSDVYRCQECAHRFLYWDAVHDGSGRGRDKLACPECGHVQRKSDYEWVDEVPVQTHTSQDGKKINAHAPSMQELQLIETAEKAPIPYWTPDVSFGPERPMWRASHRAMGIETVSDFFTRRNLHALAALRHAIIKSSSGRVRQALMFAFTGCVNRASRRYQWNAKRPTNVMSGTLYISSLRYEWNVWSLFRRKAADVIRYYRKFPGTEASCDVFQHSASELDCLPDNSVDMVFMDPPFGANIYYADSSLLWEAWLGSLTDSSSEIVVHRGQRQQKDGNSVAKYGDLMRQAFSHAARILKPNGKAVLAFSNSDDSVWQVIQSSLQDAGFVTEAVHTLHKGQPSIKGVKGVSGQEHVTTLDLVLVLRVSEESEVKRQSLAVQKDFVDKTIWAAVHDASNKGGVPTDKVYSLVVRGALEQGYSLSGVTMPSIAERCSVLGLEKRNDGWRAPSRRSNSTVSPFVSGYLTNIDSLPQSGGNSLEVKSPLHLRRTSGRRNTALYVAHSYHTKVPPEAIVPYLEHFTSPGDVVLDPFCGSGMTGVAAAETGRRAILSDLSPAAIHLSWNHTRPCDPQKLADAFRKIESAVEKEFDDLYSTIGNDGERATINWVMWSIEYLCSECRNPFLLWNAIDRTAGRLGKTVRCPECDAILKRSDLSIVGNRPAWVSYISHTDGKKYERPATGEDFRQAELIEESDIEDWYPDVDLAPDREMYIRCALHLRDITSVEDFYTRRNLCALARLWREINNVEDERVKRALAFAFTNTAWHGTKMRRFNARGGQRPLTGTLYVPQLSSEVNVLQVMRNKIRQLERYYAAYKPSDVDLPALRLEDASHLGGVPDESIDYIFTDPPFGSNIFYADCNLIWESWLGTVTDGSKEAVVNKSLSEREGGKSLEDYASIMKKSMREMVRVLRPGGWATVVFHNTDSKVWQAIYDAANAAGFTFYEAGSLDRAQLSHKGYKGRSGAEDVAHFDVIFNLRKEANSSITHEGKKSNATVDLDAIIADIARDEVITAHGLQGVHSEVMRRLASHEENKFVDFSDVKAAWLRYMNGGGRAIEM